jgi:hypothetical protein
MGATCQSCGMPLGKDLQKGGTNADGTKSTRFCSFCYADGKFRHPDFTVQEMQEHCVAALRNKGVPRPLAWLLTRGIPRLERWRTT